MVDVNHLCPGCMGLWEDTERPCPRCGFSWETAPAGGRELPIFTILAGRYLLGKRIGVGGFGITYLAMDLAEERVTAIKEFFPASLASREGLEVAALPGEEGRYFREALRSFHKEADLLSRFVDVPGIVRYRDYVTENGTAYLVMDYIEGTNLRRYMRETGKTFAQEEALGLMRPILLAVDAMHRKNVLHRDISPENLILKPDGTLTLIDFGAAREFSLDEEENLTVILKHGYAPEEQYHSGSRQGYQMVSGIQPQDAAARARKDDLLTLDEIEGVQVTERFARIIEKGMTIHATERYASIQALMAELYGDCAEQPEQKKVGPDGQKPERQGRDELEHEELKREKRQEDKPEGQSAEEQKPEKREEREERREPEAAPGAASPGAHAKRKASGKKAVIAAAAAALVVLVVLFAFRVIPPGGSGSASDGMTAWDSFGENQEPDMQEDGLVWLMTGRAKEYQNFFAAADYFVGQEIFEYDEKGHFSRITTYGCSPADYIMSVGSGVDPSYGEMTYDFSYQYDVNNRILSSVQTTGAESQYEMDVECQFVYWDDTHDIPKEIQIQDSGVETLEGYQGSHTIINLDESGRIKKELATGPLWSSSGIGARIQIYEYLDGEIQGYERIYCEKPEDNEALWKFLAPYLWHVSAGECELVGAEYQVSDEQELIWCEAVEPVETYADGTSSVYLEFMDVGAQSAISSVDELYREVSVDYGYKQDEFGNVLMYEYDDSEFEISDFFSYAEYEVKDGIYTPTGRTSGTLPEIAGEMQEDNSENSVNGTTGDTSPENTGSFADTGKQEEVLELLERYGIDYMMVDEVKEEYPDDSEAYIAEALLTGEIMSLVGCRLTTLEGLAPGIYAVLPPEDWFLDDGTEAWTILTADMRTCWEISEALLEEGYYAEGGKAWGFFGHLSDTGADAEGNGLIAQENDQLRFEIYAQYLEYWGERTGKDWSITNPDTGETVSKNE